MRKVTAVVVSKMDRPLGAVLDSIIPHVDNVTVVKGFAGVFERWQAAEISLFRSQIIYVQDDDVLVDVPAVLEAYEEGVITCNMPPSHRRDYPDGIALVGWGSVFDWHSFNCGPHRTIEAEELDDEGKPVWSFEWDLCNQFKQYADAGFGFDEVFRRECDRVFTALWDVNLIDVPFTHLPEAHGKDRMSLDPKHGYYLQEIRRRIAAARKLEER
jgi:hypothetical protein